MKARQKTPAKPRGKKPATISMRRQAAAMLAAIERGKTLDEAADHLQNLDARDQTYARAIVLTALRRHGEILALIDAAVSKPIPPRPHLARALLQIGLAQLLFLDTAAHAAIHETVNACGRAEQPYRGLIHAVLRRYQREKPHTEIRQNIPAWLAARWDQNYGTSARDAMAAIFAERPPLDLAFATPADAAAWLAEHGPDHKAVGLTQTAIRLFESGRVDQLPGFASGQWWVQDMSAQIAGLGFSSAGETLDLCAAPGGKTLQLLHAGHAVTAVDISANRLARLAENLTRCGPASGSSTEPSSGQLAQLVEADILDWAPARQWPRVLLDAPCSATGTLRRHPDILLHRKADDIDDRAALQKKLIDRAWALTAPGGELIYCVCSLEPEEGEEQARQFLCRHPDATQLPYQDHEMPAALSTAVTQEGFVRLLPPMVAGGLDGFFIARWRKQAA